MFNATRTSRMSGWALCWLGALLIWPLLPPTNAQAQSKKPRFIHRTPTSPKPGRPLTIKGTIINAGDLDFARFRYRKIGSRGSYKTFRLKQIGPVFQVTLPGSLIIAPGIEYYVIGTMFSGRTRVLAGGLGNPLQIIVVGGADEIKKLRPPDRRTDPDNPNDPTDPDPGGNTKKSKKGMRKGGGEIVSRKLTIRATTRQDTPLHLAPGTTSVITAQDIDNYGWRTLLDVLRNAGSMDINRGGLFPDVGMRGVNFLRTGGSGVLFLIDGHDMSFRQMQRNLVSPSWISVDDIERIEIIRGAHSGIWGSGALQGVVQIITKSGKNMRGYSATLGIGPMSGTHFLTVRGGDQFKNGLSIYTSLSVHQEFRSALLHPILEFTYLEQPVFYNPAGDRMLGQNFLFKMDYKGFFFTVHQGRHDASVPINAYSVIGGEDTRFVTDRLIMRAGWQGKFGKSNHFRGWVSFDRMTINPDTQISMNPLSSAAGSAPDGRSATFQVGGQYAPQCENVTNPDTVCVRIVTVSYEEAGEKKQEQACYLAKRSDNPAPTAPVEVTPDQKDKLWFAFPTNCQPASTGGRYNRKLRAEDNRLQVGLQLALQPIKSLKITGGVEVEYLSSTVWHFPSIWNEQIKGQENLAPNGVPSYDNFRVGAFLQGQFQLGKWANIHGAFRFDFDQRIGSSIGPQAGVVVTPGMGIFAKLNYSLGFRNPSLYELSFYEGNSYGNPELFNETVHSINMQVGWLRKKLLYVALNGFFNIFNDPIRPTFRSATDALGGRGAEYPFEYPVPDPTSNYTQLTNRVNGINSFGGELEARLMPFKGLEFTGYFGLAFATEIIDDEGNQDRVPYSAGLFAGLSAAYRYKLFRISLGLLYVGSKLVPNTAFGVTGNLPADQLRDSTTSIPVPSWTADKNPRAPTIEDIPRADGYVQLHLTIQFLRLFGHLDLAIRAQNITGLGMASYDASNPILLPQKGFELLTWIKYNY